MVHGTSHHLGLDVHDCAQARDEHYREGTLAPGMVITVEPGLYFKADDLLVPAELRGIGVRIEDDVLITDDGQREPVRRPAPEPAREVEAWMASIWIGPEPWREADDHAAPHRRTPRSSRSPPPPPPRPVP